MTPGLIEAWCLLARIEQHLFTPDERARRDAELTARLYGEASVGEAGDQLGAGGGEQAAHDASVHAGRAAEVYQRLVENIHGLLTADGALPHQPHQRRGQQIAEALAQAFDLGLHLGAAHARKASTPPAQEQAA